jgi:hypothetical protein
MAKCIAPVPVYRYTRIMARPRTPEGKRVTMGAKFSEAQAAEIDAARGVMNRSEWLRHAALAATERQRAPAAHTDRQVQAVRQNRTAANGDCPHPKARINKGLCGACGTYVGTTKGGR